MVHDIEAEVARFGMWSAYGVGRGHSTCIFLDTVTFDLGSAILQLVHIPTQYMMVKDIM